MRSDDVVVPHARVAADRLGGRALGARPASVHGQRPVLGRDEQRVAALAALEQLHAVGRCVHAPPSRHAAVGLGGEELVEERVEQPRDVHLAPQLGAEATLRLLELGVHERAHARAHREADLGQALLVARRARRAAFPRARRQQRQRPHVERERALEPGRLVLARGHARDDEHLGPAQAPLAQGAVDLAQLEQLRAHADQLGHAPSIEAEARLRVVRGAAVAGRLVEAPRVHLDQVEGQHPPGRLLRSRRARKAPADLVAAEPGAHLGRVGRAGRSSAGSRPGPEGHRRCRRGPPSWTARREGVAQGHRGVGEVVGGEGHGESPADVR